MSKTLKNRLQHAERQLDAVPVRPAVARAAFERFRSTGDLPQDQRIAWLVVQRARAGYDCFYDDRIQFDRQRSIRAGVAAKPRPDDPVMDRVYDEAVRADGMVRAGARVLLQTLAAIGLDPSEPLFAGKDMHVPDYGGAGLFLLGIPRRWATRPYKRQGERLFARYDVLRSRVPHSNRAWFARMETAAGCFHQLGELPDDELLRDAVLADAELRTLRRHADGEDVAEVMAAFDAAARTEGAERDTAWRVLSGMATTGRFLPNRQVQ